MEMKEYMESDSGNGKEGVCCFFREGWRRGGMTPLKNFHQIFKPFHFESFLL